MKINFSILNIVTAKNNNCPEIFKITGQFAPFFLAKEALLLAVIGKTPWSFNMKIDIEAKILEK